MEETVNEEMTMKQKKKTLRSKFRIYEDFHSHYRTIVPNSFRSLPVEYIAFQENWILSSLNCDGGKEITNNNITANSNNNNVSQTGPYKWPGTAWAHSWILKTNAIEYKCMRFHIEAHCIKIECWIHDDDKERKKKKNLSHTHEHPSIESNRVKQWANIYEK